MSPTHQFVSKRRLYYGWYVAGACTFIAAITHGIGILNQGVFLAYFTQEYGWSPSASSLGPMLFQIWAGVAGIVVGRYIDRRGPRVAQLVGALALAAGALTLGRLHQLWQTYPAFLLLGTGFSCLHNVTLGKIIARWFRRDRARAMALATIGTNLGGMIVVPLTATVLHHWGGLAGGLMLAMMALGVIVPLALWVIRDGPEALGLSVDGSPVPVEDAALIPTGEGEYQWTLAEAMQTLPFWALAISFPLVVMVQTGFVVHQVLIYQASFGLLGAAGVVAVTHFTGMLSRVSLTLFAPRWPSRHMASGVYLLEVLGLLILAFGETAWLQIVSAAILGCAMSLTVTLEPVISSECFGQITYGRIYGPIYFGTRLAAALGALLYGVLASATGSYQQALCVMAAALFLATCSIQMAIPPVKQETQA
jgi:MFS family permease